ncbi:protein S100-A3 isoform X1 [Sapajus apella]|nr:protein S100-A3 isoform X1 [Sapajus apella]
MRPEAWWRLSWVWEQSLRNMEGRGEQGAGLELCCESRPCSVTGRMTRPLEQAVAAIVCTFQEYAGRCGDKHKLCQAELKELLQKELPTWTPTEFRECDYNKFMSVLDTNKDCEVDFVEYVRSLACLCLYCHEYFKDCAPEPPCPQ